MPTIDSTSFHSTSVDEASRFFSENYGRTRIEAPAEGDFAIAVSSGLVDGMSSFSLVSPSGMGFTTAFDGYSVAFALESGLVRCEADADAATVIVDWRNAPRIWLGRNFSAVGLTFTVGEINRALSLLLDGPVSERLRFDAVPARRPVVYALLGAIAATIREGFDGEAPLKHSPVAAAHLKDAALNLLLQGMPHNYTARLAAGDSQPSPRHVRRAIEFMQANIARPIALADIVQASGASARSLQAGFRRFKESTPMNYLRQLRLGAVRAELLDARSRDSIASIAQRWGFTHIGSFSAAYQQAYGELPSETYRARASGGA